MFTWGIPLVPGLFLMGRGWGGGEFTPVRPAARGYPNQACNWRRDTPEIGVPPRTGQDSGYPSLPETGCAAGATCSYTEGLYLSSSFQWEISGAQGTSAPPHGPKFLHFVSLYLLNFSFRFSFSLGGKMF